MDTNWRRTRIVWANFIQHFLVVTLIANSSYFLQLGGLSANNSVMLIAITDSLVLPGVIVSWFAMTMFGRRISVLVGTAAVGLLWTAVGIAVCFPNTTAFWYVAVFNIP